MDNTYKILFTQSKQPLVINEDWVPIADKITQITQDLIIQKYKGEVIFNSFSVTQDKNRQFFTAYFDGERILGSTFNTHPKIENNTMLQVQRFFKKNTNLKANLVNEVIEKH